MLFVCIGNSCRSQMAEAFARAYGSDVLEPYSAGLSPAVSVAPLTRKVLEERNVHVDGQFPKGLNLLPDRPFDVVINLSGLPLVMPAPQASALVLEWSVRDPIGQSEAVYRSVASQVEALVMRLILDFRSGRAPG